MAPNSDKKKPAGRGFQRRNKGGQSRRNYLLGNNTKNATDSDSAVPLLKFGAYNNWLKFKEKMATACTEKYGYLGRLIDTEEYYTLPAIDMVPYQGWQSDELKKTLYLDEAKDKARKERAMVQDQPKMYAYILSKLSKESLDELKHHADYDTAHDEQSPKALWILLREIHATNTSTTNSLILKKEAFNQYTSCKQGQYETIADFKERFDYLYQNYLEQKNTRRIRKTGRSTSSSAYMKSIARSSLSFSVFFCSR